ncbi:hypothetical protein ACGTRS_04905 [Burkholderia semiarida]|uniref:Uncharacterized protein n=1 Tax=Burkholderia semiarida TaxID=2843303 RepID=A0ABW7L165_9BURK
MDIQYRRVTIRGRQAEKTGTAGKTSGLSCADAQGARDRCAALASSDDVAAISFAGHAPIPDRKQ